jgi:hypothetical protein
MFGLVLALIPMIFKKFRPKIIEKLKKTKNNFFWNGMIRSLTLSYMGICISTAKLHRMKQENSIFLEEDNYKVAKVMTVYIFLLPLVSFLYLIINRDNLAEETQKNKVENLYLGVRTTESYAELMYFPQFLFRRIVFCFLPVIFFSFPFLQVQCVTFFTSL